MVQPDFYSFNWVSNGVSICKLDLDTNGAKNKVNSWYHGLAYKAY